MENIPGKVWEGGRWIDNLIIIPLWLEMGWMWCRQAAELCIPTPMGVNSGGLTEMVHLGSALLPEFQQCLTISESISHVEGHRRPCGGAKGQSGLWDINVE